MHGRHAGFGIRVEHRNHIEHADRSNKPTDPCTTASEGREGIPQDLRGR